MINSKKDNIAIDNALVLANAGELVAGVINSIAGNDISNSINGVRITNDSVNSIVYNRLSNAAAAAVNNK